MKTKEQYGYGDTWLQTGGLIVLGALVCLLVGTISFGGLVAALLAAYVVLALTGAMARADR